ncbi:hypothetical protein BDK51DRAFT_47077 [Blyttiomyces helicus]|uniref:Sphingomyelin phosphodiesterase n=1 Tax=Blyttiomyces helicus TaxID=388810 RepID=A0A4P9WKD6_9FUNG|nr:hypothetical protein BDK51DRAFT_47077 [Blyttiomyces helicus]|eukprot:RKO92575.1 hypothetical protein BDK51DRAFT_47077 [Blyttiomyces helicus]
MEPAATPLARLATPLTANPSTNWPAFLANTEDVLKWLVSNADSTVAKQLHSALANLCTLFCGQKDSQTKCPAHSKLTFLTAAQFARRFASNETASRRTKSPQDVSPARLSVSQNPPQAPSRYILALQYPPGDAPPLQTLPIIYQQRIVLPDTPTHAATPGPLTPGGGASGGFGGPGSYHFAKMHSQVGHLTIDQAKGEQMHQSDDIRGQWLTSRIDLFPDMFEYYIYYFALSATFQSHPSVFEVRSQLPTRSTPTKPPKHGPASGPSVPNTTFIELLELYLDYFLPIDVAPSISGSSAKYFSPQPSSELTRRRGAAIAEANGKDSEDERGLHLSGCVRVMPLLPATTIFSLARPESPSIPLAISDMDATKRRVTTEFMIGAFVELWLCQNDFLEFNSAEQRLPRPVSYLTSFSPVSPPRIAARGKDSPVLTSFFYFQTYLKPTELQLHCVYTMVRQIARLDLRTFIPQRDPRGRDIVLDETSQSRRSGRNVEIFFIAQTAVLTLAKNCRSAYNFLQSNLYGFLRLAFDHWPRDESFALVVDIWIAFITPWRALGSQTYTDDWAYYIHANYIYYARLLLSFLDRVRSQNYDLYGSSRRGTLPSSGQSTPSKRSTFLALESVVSVFDDKALLEVLRVMETALFSLDTYGGGGFDGRQLGAKGGIADAGRGASAYGGYGGAAPSTPGGPSWGETNEAARKMNVLKNSGHETRSNIIRLEGGPEFIPVFTCWTEEVADGKEGKNSKQKVLEMVKALMYKIGDVRDRLNPSTVATSPSRPGSRRSSGVTRSPSNPGVAAIPAAAIASLSPDTPEGLRHFRPVRPTGCFTSPTSLASLKLFGHWLIFLVLWVIFQIAVNVVYLSKCFSHAVNYFEKEPLGRESTTSPGPPHLTPVTGRVLPVPCLYESTAACSRQSSSRGRRHRVIPRSGGPRHRCRRGQRRGP